MLLKTALASLLVLGSLSIADAMPMSPVAPDASPPIVKAAVVVVKKVVRRRPPVHRTVVKKTIIRR